MGDPAGKGQALLRHIKDIENAVDFMEKLGDPRVKHKELKPNLALLQGHDMKPNVQRRILAIYVRDMGDSLTWDDRGDAEMLSLVRALSPFPTRPRAMTDDSAKEESDSRPEATVEASACEEGKEFDPLNPRLSDIDSDLLSKLDAAQKILVRDILTSLAGQGEDSFDAAIALAKAVEQTYVQGVMEMEEVPAAASETLTIFRFIRSVIDTTNLDVDFDSVMAVANSQKDFKKGLLCEAANIVDRSAQWQDRKSGLIKTIAQARSQLPKLATKLETLPDQPFALSDVQTLAKITDAFDHIRCARGALRPGSTHLLETKARKLLSSILDHHEATTAEGIRKLAVEDASALQSLLQDASSLWQDEAVSACLALCEEERQGRSNEVILATICDSFEAAAGNISEEGIQLEKLSLVSEQLEQNLGLSFDTDQAERVVTIAQKVYDSLAESFPEKLEAMPIAAKVLDTCAGCKGAENLSKAFQALSVGEALSAAADKHTKLADDVYGRVANDENYSAIKEIMQTKLKLEVAATATNTTEPECLKALRAKVEKLVDDVATTTITPQQAKVLNLIDGCSDWTRGGSEGKPWSDAVADDADISDILDAGKKTLCSRSAEVYESTRDDIKASMSKLRDTSTLFNRKVDADIDTRCAAACKELTLSYHEGLLVALYSSKQAKEVMKARTHAIKKQVKAPLKWVDVHARLRERAERAMKLLS